MSSFFRGLFRGRLSYANVTATVALFFALSGGALAASHYLITSTRQIKPSVLSALKGAVGKAGPAGAPGAAGANGVGTPGAPGAAGANGVSPEGVPFAVGVSKGPCSTNQGGVEFKGVNTTFACNGKNGATGFTEVLPAGKTEEGTWSVGTSAEASSEFVGFASISFAIPLGVALSEADVHVLGVGGKTTECPGSVAKPQATAGNLCVYTQEEFGTSFLAAIGLSTAGVVLLFGGTALTAYAFGAWAVSAPEA
jgi:hypothetical protein